MEGFIEVKKANERGLTLVEILAALAISSLLMLLIFSTVVFIQNQYKDQSSDSMQLNDLTYIAKVMTKDARKANRITIGEDSITFTLSNSDANYKYNHVKKTIEKNGKTLASNIEGFVVEVPEDSNPIEKVNIQIIGPTNKKIETVIAIREGDESSEQPE